MEKRNDDVLKKKDDTAASGCDSSTAFTLEIAEERAGNIKTEAELADLYYRVMNRAIRVEDDQYFLEEGTEEYIRAVQIADAWFSLLDRLENRIFDILRAEGVEIPETGTYYVLQPFMIRNGYRCCGGDFFPKEEGGE